MSAIGSNWNLLARSGDSRTGNYSQVDVAENNELVRGPPQTIAAAETWRSQCHLLLPPTGSVRRAVQELSSDSDHHDERQAITDAASTIVALKKDKSSHSDEK